MAGDFLGRGLKFPIQIDQRGGVALTQNENKIRESILIILNTAKGERMMRPEFGCDIHEFVFSVIDTSTLALIKAAVREALILWETRIEVLAIEITTEKIRDDAIEIHIDYKIRSTNTEFNLVYPFYLKPRGG